MDEEIDQVLLEPAQATEALSAHAEASKMLEAALQQMDGIIAGQLKEVLQFSLVSKIECLFDLAGTQQELRKLDAGSPMSLKEAVDQLQAAIDYVGADRNEATSIVLELLGMVSLNRSMNLEQPRGPGCRNEDHYETERGD